MIVNPNTWSTPRAEDGEQTGPHRGDPDTLTSAARWATPTSSIAKGGVPQDSKQKRDLRLDMAMWQTPQAVQSDGGHRSRGGKRANELLLAGQAVQANGSTNGRGHGSLNPAWVLQLQGFPDGWLDLSDEAASKLLETHVSPKLSK